jgi:hypothetical protein
MTNATTTNYLAVAGPHGDLFPRLEARTDAEQYALAPEQLTAFERDGFLHNVPILTPAQVARLRDGLERIVSQQERKGELVAATEDPQTGGKLTYLQGAWMIDEAIHDLVFHPAITVKLAQLLSTPRVRFWHDQVFYKPPRVGGNVAWHQDYSYWQRATPSQHLTVWIGLDDSTLENGCLHVVPGSHRWPMLDPTALTGDMDTIKAQLAPDQRAQFRPVALEQPAGTCSFHHDHIVHGSFANTSERPRRAIILNYMADGTRSAAADGVLMPGYKPIPAGQKIEGDWFPLVIDLEKFRGEATRY